VTVSTPAVYGRHLTFARAEGAARDRVTFGIGPQRAELTADNFRSLRRAGGGPLYYRRPDSPASTNRYFRLQAERWLEASSWMTLPGSSRNSPPIGLLPDPCLSGQRSREEVDILGAGLDGTLVVWSSRFGDPGLPLQAPTTGGGWYSTKFRRLLCGELFQRSQAEPPAAEDLSRVARVLFHDTTEKILHFTNPE